MFKEIIVETWAGIAKDFRRDYAILRDGLGWWLYPIEATVIAAFLSVGAWFIWLIFK